jgi:hypothetical protein
MPDQPFTPRACPRISRLRKKRRVRKKTTARHSGTTTRDDVHHAHTRNNCSHHVWIRHSMNGALA